MARPTTDKLQIELKENKQKIEQITTILNGLKVRNIQLEAILEDRFNDPEEKEKILCERLSKSD
jgi:hypothetical protein|tara:strand:- start:72 stop:263 length:192 start_codon:yes stop_codon:yes gene_type:complete